MAQGVFPITVGTDDGRTKRANNVPTWPPSSGDSAQTGTADQWLQTYSDFSGGFYDYSESLLRWDTSSLPNDATIWGATLRLYHSGSAGSPANCKLHGDWYNAASAIAAGDWIDYGSAPLDAFTNYDSDTFPDSATFDVTLSNAAANINLTGYTGIRLHLRPDSPPPVDSAPVVFLAAYDHATLPEPVLIVDYDPFQGTAAIAWFTA